MNDPENSTAEIRLFIIAGEASGDNLAAELIESIRILAPGGLRLNWCGSAGSRMRGLGVRSIVNLPDHAVVGLIEPLRKIGFFRDAMRRLVEEAVRFRPHAVIMVDYSGFNLRFARRFLGAIQAPPYGQGKRPRMIYFISPQVWASRASRAAVLESHFDRLLSIFPFERKWYESHAPKLRVEFVGHPLVDRYPEFSPEFRPESERPQSPKIVLLPGSRHGEIRHHWPVMLQAALRLKSEDPGRQFCVVVPSGEAARWIQETAPLPEASDIEIHVGNLSRHLDEADLAIACSGTVTMECAWFRVPAVVVYRTSWITYQVARRIITVPWLAMPNILAGEELYPELIQQELTGQRLHQLALQLLCDVGLRNRVRRKLDEMCRSLGASGPGRRAAEAVLSEIHQSTTD